MTRVSLLLVLLLTLAACSHSQPIQILNGEPGGAFRTLGMLSGQGENRDSAIHAVLEQAERLEADAVIIDSERPLGRVLVVTARAIRFLGPPPQ